MDFITPAFLAHLDISAHLTEVVTRVQVTSPNLKVEFFTRSQTNQVIAQVKWCQISWNSDGTFVTITDLNFWPFLKDICSILEENEL